jgi:hypothetical protein
MLGVTMLVFFIHGVATQNVGYADGLKKLIKNDFVNNKQNYPHFYSSFWGDVLNDVGKLWNYIDKDLQDAKSQYSRSQFENIFRYREFREEFFSRFIGDFFAYMNPERGAKIRQKVASQLCDFLNQNSLEKELHIVAHSLGSVILWDLLFSNRFQIHQDSAFLVREVIQGFSDSKSSHQVVLKSITTMGSPVLFVNTMLDLCTEATVQFTEHYKNAPLRWTNIIHASDIIAYPIKSSLQKLFTSNISIKDEYLIEDANLIEKTVRTIGQENIAMVAGSKDSHIQYLNCEKTANIIIDNLTKDSSENNEDIKTVILRLLQVSGMTKDENQNNLKFSQLYTRLKDRSGTLYLYINQIQIHHIYVLNAENILQFGGYVGWIDTSKFLEELEFIKSNFGE